MLLNQSLNYRNGSGFQRLKLHKCTQTAVIQQFHISGSRIVSTADSEAAKGSSKAYRPLTGSRSNGQNAFAVSHGIRPGNLSAVKHLLNGRNGCSLQGFELHECTQTAVVYQLHVACGRIISTADSKSAKGSSKSHRPLAGGRSNGQNTFAISHRVGPSDFGAVQHLHDSGCCNGFQRFELHKGAQTAVVYQLHISGDGIISTADSKGTEGGIESHRPSVCVRLNGQFSLAVSHRVRPGNLSAVRISRSRFSKNLENHRCCSSLQRLKLHKGAQTTVIQQFHISGSRIVSTADSEVSKGSSKAYRPLIVLGDNGQNTFAVGHGVRPFDSGTVGTQCSSICLFLLLLGNVDKVICKESFLLFAVGCAGSTIIDIQIGHIAVIGIPLGQAAAIYIAGLGEVGQITAHYLSQSVVSVRPGLCFSEQAAQPVSDICGVERALSCVRGIIVGKDIQINRQIGMCGLCIGIHLKLICKSLDIQSACSRQSVVSLGGIGLQCTIRQITKGIPYNGFVFPDRQKIAVFRQIQCHTKQAGITVNIADYSGYIIVVSAFNAAHQIFRNYIAVHCSCIRPSHGLHFVCGHGSHFLQSLFPKQLCTGSLNLIQSIDLIITVNGSAHDKGFVKQTLSQRGSDQCIYGKCTGRLAHNGHIVGIAAELGDIALDPFKRLDPVQHSIVSRSSTCRLSRQFGMSKETKNTDTIVDADIDHILTGHQFAVINGAGGAAAVEAAAMNVNNDRTSFFNRTGLGPDVQGQAVFGQFGIGNKFFRIGFRRDRIALHSRIAILSTSQNSAPAFRSLGSLPAQFTNRSGSIGNPLPHGNLAVLGQGAGDLSAFNRNRCGRVNFSGSRQVELLTHINQVRIFDLILIGFIDLLPFETGTKLLLSNTPERVTLHYGVACSSAADAAKHHNQGQNDCQYFFTLHDLASIFFCS